MKALAALIVCLALAGCEYAVPLAQSPKMPIDPALVGLWERPQGGGQTETLLVLPLSAREYLVEFPENSTNSLFAKACLCSCAGKTMVQLRWIGTERGQEMQTDHPYQFAAYEVTGTELKVRMLNSGVVGKEWSSSRSLARAVKFNRNRADLFGEPMVFSKAK